MADEDGLAQSLSDGVEAAIKQVMTFEKQDELDLADFDPIEYINSTFPSEESLSTLDATLGKFDKEIQSLDDQILGTVREQSTAGVVAAKDLDEAKGSITELFTKIGEIRTKAEQSEVMVQDICRDIRALDLAKRHLTTTITVLKRLQMLVTAVDRLEANSSSGQYENAGQLLQAVAQLFTNFAEYRSVPKVAELMESVGRIKIELRDRIIRDFDTLTELGAAEAMGSGGGGGDGGGGGSGSDDDGGYDHDPYGSGGHNGGMDYGGMGMEAPVTSLETLRQACEVVDALEGDVRQRLIDSFCSKQLAPYESMCRTEEAQALGAVDRRYHWFRRMLRDLQTKFASVLPRHWHVPHHVAAKFCKKTRSDIERILSQYEDPDSAPPDALVGALQKTLAFETEMKRRFEPKAGGGGSGAGSGAGGGGGGGRDDMVDDDDGDDDDDKAQEDWLRSLSKDGTLSGIRQPSTVTLAMEGVISTAFGPYMGAYVQWEKAQFESLISTASSTGDVDSTSSLPVLQSSAQMFFAIRNAVSRCVKLSTGQTLYKLYDAIKAGLKSYCDMLTGRLPLKSAGSPYPGDTYKVTLEEAGDICLVINTAEYCADTLPQLSASLRDKVDEAYKEHIDLEPTEDLFRLDLTSQALKALASGVACMLDPALDALSRMNWTGVEEVGDQSDYVADMQGTVRDTVPVVRQKLTAAFFTNFCDKFARAFTPRYMAALYRSKKIGEMGASQMLLDAQAIKTMLLKTPVLLTDDEEYDGVELPPASPMFVKFVTREMPRVELLLKLIITPKDRFAESIKMLWQDASAQDLKRVMELKSMTRSEQRDVLDALGLSSSGAGATVRSVMGRFTTGIEEALRRK